MASWRRGVLLGFVVAALAIPAASLPGEGRSRERLVRVRKGGAGGPLAILMATSMSGRPGELQVTSFEPIVVGETFEVVSENGRLGSMTLRNVTRQRLDCGEPSYVGQGELLGAVKRVDARVFVVRVGRPLGAARLVRGNAVDDDFARDTESALEVAIDADGDGQADYARAGASCPGREGPPCLELYERRDGHWRVVQRTPMPFCE